MHDSPSAKKPLIALVLVAAVIGGAWYLLRGSRGEAMHAAVDETVEVFVPGPARMQRRTAAVHGARALTDTINARSQPRQPSTR